MLIFTNREVDDSKRDEAAFGRAFKPFDTRLGLATVEKKGGSKWQLTNIDADVSNQDARDVLGPLFNGRKPVLVYIHGNNNSPAKCFERCDRLRALYSVEVVGFSWASEGFTPEGPSLPGVPVPDTDDEDDLKGIKGGNDGNTEKAGIQGKIRRYHQAKTNAQHSAQALARFLRMVAAARLIANQPFTLAAHSLGVHFLQNSLDVSGASESLATAHNVALLAACARAAGHADWLAKIRPKGQVFVTYNKGDTVLFAANVADGAQIKLGGDLTEFSQIPGVRYISFTGGQVGAWGHRYFLRDNMPDKALKIFTRMFSSERDIQDGEIPRKIYPVGCDADGRICYMAGPAVEDR